MIAVSEKQFHTQNHHFTNDRLHHIYVNQFSFVIFLPLYLNSNGLFFPFATASLPILTKTGSFPSINFTCGVDNSMLDLRRQLSFQKGLCRVLCGAASFQKWKITRDAKYAYE